MINFIAGFFVGASVAVILLFIYSLCDSARATDLHMEGTDDESDRAGA